MDMLRLFAEFDQLHVAVFRGLDHVIRRAADSFAHNVNVIVKRTISAMLDAASAAVSQYLYGVCVHVCACTNV